MSASAFPAERAGAGIPDSEPAVAHTNQPTVAGIPDSSLAGPFAVGEYATALRNKLRSFTRVQLIGELVNLRLVRTRAYFELRDAGGERGGARSAWCGASGRARGCSQGHRRTGEGGEGRRAAAGAVASAAAVGAADPGGRDRGGGGV